MSLAFQFWCGEDEWWRCGAEMRCWNAGAYQHSLHILRSGCWLLVPWGMSVLETAWGTRTSLNLALRHMDWASLRGTLLWLQRHQPSLTDLQLSALPALVSTCSAHGCLGILAVSCLWALEAGLHWTWEAADLWHLHAYTLWSHPHQSVTGMKHRQMQHALSSQQCKKRFTVLKNWFTFPRVQQLGAILTVHGEECLSLSSSPQVRFGEEWLDNCGRVLLGQACPEPACNESKTSCFTSTATLNKLKSHSAADKLWNPIGYEQL